MRARVLAIALVTVAAPVAAQSPTAVLDRAVRAYKNVKTVRASFTQTITNPLLGQTVSSAGEMVQRRPNHVSVRFTDPAGDRIVADGSWVWFYLPSSIPGQVIRQRIASGVAGSPDLTAQFLDAPSSRFNVTDLGREKVNGRAARVLSLVPKPGVDAAFTKAVVWVDSADALIRQFELTEPSEVVRRVTITRLTLNPTIPASAFRFTPPSGTKVIDQ
ncbi:MAG TPA: outer membrane lipoprotein carrier protein LolA [Gemmatimonadaceae bacterium]|nr:outer membrane lipoprotein carrier protein LolA [Gemmatimonadaceae bacterium]